MASFRIDPIATYPRSVAFTLIELLVVITIIVVLLALLTPALDKAIYQAQLTQCAGNQKAVASTALVYAGEHQRRYFYRSWVNTVGERSFNLRWRDAGGTDWDDRPMLRQYLDINRSFNCPLGPKYVILDGPGIDEDTSAFANYGLWAGFGYRGESGMFKLGDRMTVEGDAFNLLVGDWDGYYEQQGPEQDYGSHPDQDKGVLKPGVSENTPGLLVIYKVTYALWHASPAGPNSRRGLLDMNYGFADGSVRRYDSVERAQLDRTAGDERMVNIPARQMLDNLSWRVSVPRQ